MGGIGNFKKVKILGHRFQLGQFGAGQCSIVAIIRVNAEMMALK